MNYQEHALAGATGVDLIVALYDGWIRFLHRAADAADDDDVIERRFAVKRSLDILMYLEARLRPDIGGEPARALSDFYAAMFTMTLEASSAGSAKELRKVVDCVRNVKEAWVIVARDPEANRVLPRELRTAQERRPQASALFPPASANTVQTTKWSA
ncbi:flagellin-specific chaperone FliS [Terriglobus roseus DSM 18391]|uniref:Flagellin-specific chaperone FliS n=1 Tax=Terriglobus roseus (strain DSM 18391 / NRRL B-41598 / KBS 63) TaxID=926566 RepID=I3ZEG4_TERRK|nr:flagellar export chaperone FliS [Terriglobus roseus]AFL87632.1 flagellin-specific chaperone FliS [Terriglobus roseus DSM 18391]